MNQPKNSFYLQPQTLPKGNVLVLSPHPDDESFGCAGALLKHHHQKDIIFNLQITDGEKCFYGTPMEKKYSPHEVIQLRRNEAKKAFQALSFQTYEFLSMPDGVGLPLPELSKKIAFFLNKMEATTVYIPYYDDSHMDHKSTNRAFWMALPFNKTVLHVFQYEIHKPLQPNFYVDITATIEMKKSICHFYESQNKLYPYTESICALHRYRAMKFQPPIQYIEAYFLTNLKR